MAVRKTTAKKARTPARKPRGRTAGKVERVPVPVVFWIFLFLVLITAFFALLPKVMKGVKLPLKQTVTERPIEETPLEQPLPAKPPSAEKPKPAPPAKPPPSSTRPPSSAKPLPEKPAEQKPSQPATQPQPPASPPAAQQQPAPPSQQNPPAAAKPPETETPAETRDAGIYFVQAKGGGAELTLTKVNRKLKVSGSPLQDSINALLSGPTAEEKNRGIISLIPADSRLISSLIRGNTAYLDFNEEFRYNTFGREGSLAQIRQIVWTATEFPSVRDVQFLIEGKPVDFLVEGVMIGSPVGR